LFVRRNIPDAEEATSYGMPAFKYKKRPLLGFSVSKNHLSVFPFSPEAPHAKRSPASTSPRERSDSRLTGPSLNPRSGNFSTIGCSK
jgi:hypothetical protein